MTASPAMASVLFVAIVAAAAAAQRTIAVRNLCNTTVWPAIYTRSGPLPNPGTGWEAAPGTTYSFRAQPGWIGRVWARTGCNFTGTASASQCATGACDDGILCSQATFGAQTAPATLAELTISSSGPDFYDVSIVDGFNLPLTVSSASADSNCPPATCVGDLLSDCPPQLAIETAGAAIACPSACWKALDGNAANSPNCCSGSFNTPATCPASKVQFYNYFHTKCPGAYAYAYDDSAGLHSCAGSSTAGTDYEITFCPESDVVIPSGTVSSTSSTPTSSTTPTSQTPPPTSSVTDSAPQGAQGKKTSTAAIAGGTAGAVALVFIAAGVFLCLRRKKRRHTTGNDSEPVPYPSMVTAAPPRSSALFSKALPRQSRTDEAAPGSSAVDGPPPPAYSTITTR